MLIENSGRKLKENKMKKVLPEYKSKITKQERLILLGLLFMANEHYKESVKCDVAMNKILGSKEKWGTLISDEWLEDAPNLDKVLEEMEVRVV